MATPYLVRKISLNNDCECEHCENVTASGNVLNYNSPRKSLAPASCRFSCTSWCSVCETQIQKEFGSRGQIKEPHIHSKSHEAFKQEFTPIVSPTKRLTPSLKQDSDKLVSKIKEARTYSSVAENSEDPKSIRERYIRHVETLRGRLQVLRDQFPSQLPVQIPESKKPVISVLPSTQFSVKGGSPQPVVAPSTLVKSEHRLPKAEVSREPRVKKVVVPDTKRIRRPSAEVEHPPVTPAPSPGPKRPRDESPSDKDSIESIMGSDPLSREDISLPDSNTNESDGISICSLEEDRELFPEEGKIDSEKIIRESNSSSVSPSYIVGDTLEKISLSDTPPAITNVTVITNNVDSTVHPLIRLSLFSHVPPYLRFSSHDVKEKPFPVQLQRIMKWKLTNITPLVVRKTVINSGFKFSRSNPSNSMLELEGAVDWCGSWGKHMKAVLFKTLKDHQKLNHFPGTFQIGRKDRLWRNLYHHMLKYGKKEFGFIPRTYILPQDTKLLRLAWDKQGGRAKWIIKPPASARGSGIKVINRWTQLPKKTPLIVQKYISNPYLINGSKFDLRLYVLVTSFNPLCLYLYDNGLVRFASVKYSDDPNTLGDRYMHLTNYSVNKLSSQYTQNDDANACQGHKWTVQTLWSYLDGAVNVRALKSSLRELIIKTMISGESSIHQRTWANNPTRYNSYELFGVDILLDENLKPWLLEVNISPSLHSTSPLDLAVKGPMVRDIMNIAGYHIPNKIPDDIKEEMINKLGVKGSELCFDNRLYTLGLSPDERAKQNHFSQLEERENYMSSILNDLTPDDVRHLVRYEDEITQLGNFEKIFPTNSSHEYHKFFDGPRYYNRLLDAWESKYHSKRFEGIRLLEGLCRKQVHLDVSQVEERRSLASTSETIFEDTEERDLDDTSGGPIYAPRVTDHSPKKQDELSNGNINKDCAFKSTKPRSGRWEKTSGGYPARAFNQV